MSRIKLFTVGQLAERSGVTVRTLHHYDEIGLLKPKLRGASGRRQYDRDSVLRLQQILTYRTLGLALDEIARLIDDPSFDRRAALLAQRQAVTDQIAQNEALIRGIDEALALIDRKTRKNLDMTTLFGGFDPSQFEDEAKTRWGETEAWTTSAKRSANYTEANWAQYHKEHNALCKGFAELARANASTKGVEASKLARAYADLIDRWFYPCDASHLGALADMYDGDARFRDTFDKHGEGTANFVICAFRSLSGQIQ
ncbi:MerR family transcriptional regulator [Ruegeria sp. 2205SS24-7]|uniref:MerR family transcriptional regulator n=1 Tax=Ruegeria discodermiae TaxID=3064389 RepID=UPI0027426DC1|nr:MerR family transcriptional regulator [Ruegeria sp. 2205SS24-7]MDP5218767.1 MerR family transcriptional regulator [Ruegeria sp. 2205SS24-7]